MQNPFSEQMDHVPTYSSYLQNMQIFSLMMAHFTHSFQRLQYLQQQQKLYKKVFKRAKFEKQPHIPH